MSGSLLSLSSGLAALLTLLPAMAFGQSAQDIVERMIERDRERKESVENYIIEQTIFGQRSISYFEKTSEPAQGVSDFRLVPASEIRQRQDGVLSDEELAIVGQNVSGNAAVTERLDSAVMPIPEQSTVNPWNDRERMLSLLDNAEVTGIEQIDGRPAYRIQTDDVDYAQPAMGGQEIVVDTMTFWVDQDEYVPLLFRMDGSAVIQGESREIFMEMAMQDYRRVGPMYESMRQVMRTGGLLTPEQEAQMAEAQQQIEEMEEQLEEMPAQQRQMMENMMGPQLAMLRQMVGEGTLQIETVVNSIRINAGLPDQTVVESGYSATVPAGGSQASTPLTGGAARPSREQQQACLEALLADQQEEQPRRRGLGGFLGGAARAIGQIGGFDVGDLFDRGASVEDIAEQARERGLSEEDIADCLF